MSGRKSSGWTLDVLGQGFEQYTLELQPDDEGDVVATVVRHLPNPLTAWNKPLRNVDVLYVHGWSDYFFQREEARFFTELGARFYALDLRKYGRSLRDGQTPGYITDLATYDEDIEGAIQLIGQGRNASRLLVLVGHSTGGLILTLWAARHPGVAAALILNSPWLELQIGSLGRAALAPIVGVRARYEPRGTQPVVDLGFYTRAQHDLGAGAEAYPAWRPERGFPTHPGWLNAIILGHSKIAEGVDVGCPVLVLLSMRSTPPVRWVTAMTSSDSVLVVDDIARASLKIGKLVTVARIEDAIHDVFLSAPGARAEAYAVLRNWVVAAHTSL
ncbi:alpha-beta hydrolase superfamily lysophospholipase [Microbacterium endophyticum]|uniref:Alpha-beta hydrolase superfamily lysophospholipase n=1 Tax=Microbacterium endophyticum TaxID=1526412 RepID=A0A7W4V4E1_9MICO|nr:alpha/beta hydrolase [Microbacterium endophyticum]MBB2976667.1 alpha-beta hydrolase superfamily lysophospholipase [Microbacterium endophyticum]NIK37628.1 alpha-beta hydrolase superfamily lysophospholipase [Microbacterium endophyticum]